MTRAFRLYPQERHWWSFNDYGAVLDVMLRLKPARVLEFGPGSSTLALIEGGAQHIDACEDDPKWAEVYEQRLMGKYPSIVQVHRYVQGDPLIIPSIDGQRYDMALIDGPRGTDARQPVVRYAMDRCATVLVPTEDGNQKFRPFLIALAAERGWEIEIMETGPLSGGFALLTPKADHAVEAQAEAAEAEPKSIEESDTSDWGETVGTDDQMVRPADVITRTRRRGKARKG